MLTRQVRMRLVMMLAGALMLMIMITNHVADVAMFVRMNVEHPNQQEHRQKAGQNPARDAVDRSLLSDGVGQQMQNGNPEHQAADEAHQELHVAVRQLDYARDGPARERGHGYTDAVDG